MCNYRAMISFGSWRHGASRGASRLTCLEGCDGWIWLFRQNWPEQQGWRVAFYMREKQECMKLCFGMDDESAESANG